MNMNKSEFWFKKKIGWRKDRFCKYGSYVLYVIFVFVIYDVFIFVCFKYWDNF